MPGLPKAGVQLIAEGAAKYFGDLARGQQSEQAFAAGATGAASAVNAFGGAASKNAAKVAQLTEKLAFQQRAYGILQRELQETTTKYGAGSTQAQKQQLALDRLTAGIKQTEQALNRYQNETDEAGKSSSRFSQVVVGAMREAGATVLRFAMDAGRAVLRFVGDMLKGAGQYEQSMNVLQEQSGATDEQMQQVRATAKALGADLTLPATSAADAGKAMLELSKGGLSVEQSMAAAKGTLQLAAAAETDVATAANIVTGALAAFGMEGNRATYVADLLTNAANKSRASINDVSLGFQQAAFRFHSAGQGADDLAASLTILIQAGLGGSDAGTALQNAIARLQGPTDKAAKLMKTLGINVYDANGNMLPMEQIIGVLNGALGGMTQQERNAALQTIFLSDGMKAMIPLLDAGAAGFAKTKAEMNEHGSAARMAAAQMKGMLGAAQGLVSQLETLALEGLEPLLPLFTGALTGAAKFAGSLVGQVGPAVQSAITFFGNVAHIIQDNAVPALTALGYASMIYALTQAPALIAAILAKLPVLAASTAAFTANALAVAAAAAPFAIMAAAVFAVVKAYQNFTNQLSSATDQLLASKPFWTDSTAALEQFGAASAETQAKLQPLADSIQQQRDLLHANIESLGQRMAAGAVSEAQYQREMEAINAQASAIGFASDSLRTMMQAEIDATTAQISATAATDAQAGALDQLPPKIQLTSDELDKLAKEFEEIMERGSTALGELATTHAAFLSDMATTQGAHEATIEQLMAESEQAKTEEQKRGVDARIAQEEAGYRQQLINQAKAYAEQAKAQRQALGEQLLAYIENQRQLGNITNESSAAMTQKVIEQFGIQRDSASALFGEMAQIVDRAASGQIKSMDAFGSALQETEDKAVDLREAAQTLEDEYVLTAVDNFLDAGGDAQKLKSELNSIPKKVDVTINVTTVRRERDMRGDDPSQQSPGRAFGGRVTAGHSYVVGERRAEVFVPETNGRIVPSIAQFERQYRPPAMGGERGGATNISSYQGPSYQWTIVNPQPQAVDSLANLVRIQQMLYA